MVSEEDKEQQLEEWFRAELREFLASERALDEEWALRWLARDADQIEVTPEQRERALRAAMEGLRAGREEDTPGGTAGEMAP